MTASWILYQSSVGSPAACLHTILDEMLLLLLLVLVGGDSCVKGGLGRLRNLHRGSVKYLERRRPIHRHLAAFAHDEI